MVQDSTNGHEGDAGNGPGNAYSAGSRRQRRRPTGYDGSELSADWKFQWADEANACREIPGAAKGIVGLIAYRLTFSDRPDVFKVSTNEIARRMGFTRNTVIRHLAAIRDAGYLEWDDAAAASGLTPVRRLVRDAERTGGAPGTATATTAAVLDSPDDVAAALTKAARDLIDDLTAAESYWDAFDANGSPVNAALWDECRGIVARVVTDYPPIINQIRAARAAETGRADNTYMPTTVVEVTAAAEVVEAAIVDQLHERYQHYTVSTPSFPDNAVQMALTRYRHIIAVNGDAADEAGLDAFVRREISRRTITGPRCVADMAEEFHSAAQAASAPSGADRPTQSAAGPAHYGPPPGYQVPTAPTAP